MPIELSEDQAADVLQFVKEHPHVKELHFTADGGFSLNSYPFQGKLYTRIDPDADKVKNPAVLQDRYLIVETLSREDILASEEEEAAPVAAAEAAEPVQASTSAVAAEGAQKPAASGSEAPDEHPEQTTHVE